MNLDELKAKLNAARELTDDELADTVGGFGFSFNSTMTAIVATLEPNEQASVQLTSAIAMYSSILNISSGMELVNSAAVELDKPENIGKKRTCTISFAFQADSSIAITDVTFTA